MLASANTALDWIRQLAGSPPSDEVARLLHGADDWAISAAAASMLEGLVMHRRPKSVLEFGAGRSSLVLALALQQIGGGRLTSIEHQPWHAEAAWRGIERYRDVDAQLVVAPVKMRITKHGPLYVYDGIRRALEARGPFELVVIDGPPGKFGRDWPLFAAAPFLSSSGALIMLDDVERPAEQSALRRWERALHVERLYESEGSGRRFAVVEVTAPGRPAFVWRTFLGTCHDRIRSWSASS
jgi:predicted O-methyltransferase YrrM